MYSLNGSARTPALAIPLLLLTTLLAGGCQTSPSRNTPEVPDTLVLRADYGEVRDEVAALIRRVIEQHAVQGLSVALVDDQEVVWAEGFGYADKRQRQPARPETVYRVGSIAKPFTAIAVMGLDERNEIDIDQPLHAYLPSFSIRSRFNTTAQPITVRSVLSHHSGLPTDLAKGMWSQDHFTSVAQALGQEYTAYPPEMVFSYSNVGYTLLGHMVQETTGQKFTAYMDETIFRPLGTTSTGFSLTPTIESRLSRGYRGGREAPLLPIRDLPAYSLYSNVLDLSRFMSMVFAGGKANGRELVMAGTLDEMMEVQNADVPLDLNVHNGLGWFIERDTVMGGGYVVRHGGTTLLYASEMVLLPEHRMGAVVLSNTSGSRPVVSKLAEAILQLALDAREGDRPPASGFLLAEMPDKGGDDGPVRAGGSYATDLGLIAIRPRDEKLCACVIEQTLDLIPYPDGWFGIKQRSIDALPPSHRVFGELRFRTRMIDGKEVIVAERDGQEMLLGEKVRPAPVPKAWLDRVGSYELMNPDPEFPLEEPRLWYEQGNLGMSYRMPLLSNRTVRVPLRPISATEAVILGLGRTRGETLRAVQHNGEERLRYSGYIGRKQSQ
ncbi:MAG: serine hydrolase domain-containing protein [Gammaproteobacteria bacterium]|nr:serine hydrolase domain-containing protein [Gammaproteobacteria bacterium]